MEKDNVVTEVIFRKDKSDGEIIAIFPYDICDFKGNMTCYTLQTEHGGCCLEWYQTKTSRPLPEEYEQIKAILENSVSYNLKVIQKINYDKYSKAVSEVRKCV